MLPTLSGCVNVQFMLKIIDGSTTKCNMLRDETQESTHIIIHNYAMPPIVSAIDPCLVLNILVNLVV